MSLDSWRNENDRALLREMNDKLARLDKFIADTMGGTASQIVLGRNVVTDITVDILTLMEIAGGEWSELARKHKENRMHVVPQAR